MVTEFQSRVYSLCRKVPKGKVTTYGEVAKSLGSKASRAVGNTLNKNPFSAWGRADAAFCCKQVDIVPCHRVVKSCGSIGGFALGSEKKIGLLRKEGIVIKNKKVVDFKKRLYRFK